MRYVLTGASGHIGNNLVRMINENYPEAEVIVLTRRAIGKELDRTVCRQIIGDMNDEQFFIQNIQAEDRVVHIAGLIDMTDKRQQEMHTVNYLMTEKICRAAMFAKVNKFVYVSSVDAIWKADKNAVITEPEGYYPDKIEGGYGKTKAMATQCVLNMIKEHSDFNAGVILPTAVLGIHDYKPSEAGKIIKNTLKGKAQFGLKGGYDFVDVRDVCRAILTLCNSDRTGQYIISGEKVSVKELYMFINEYARLKKRPVILPTFIVKMAVPFVKMLSKLMIKALQEPHNYSCDKAKAQLNYTPIPFEKTLHDTVDWYNEYGL